MWTCLEMQLLLIEAVVECNRRMSLQPVARLILSGVADVDADVAAAMASPALEPMQDPVSCKMPLRWARLMMKSCDFGNSFKATNSLVTLH
jgi:hypothetical protein